MPGSGPQPRKAVTGQRLAEAIAFGVGHSRVGQDLDQPIISRWWCHTPGLGDDGVDAEIAYSRVESWRLRTGDEVEAAMGHTGRVRPEVAQDLPECASVRIDVLVVGNDLKRPDRVRRHVPPCKRGRCARPPDPRGELPRGA